MGNKTAAVKSFGSWLVEPINMGWLVYWPINACLHVLELTSKHWSPGSNCYRSSVVEETVLRSPGVDMAQVCRPSSAADQHPLQSWTSPSARLPAPACWRGTARMASPPDSDSKGIMILGCHVVPFIHLFVPSAPCGSEVIPSLYPFTFPLRHLLLYL